MMQNTKQKVKAVVKIKSKIELFSAGVKVLMVLTF